MHLPGIYGTRHGFDATRSIYKLILYDTEFHLFKTRYEPNGDSRTVRWFGPYSADRTDLVDLHGTTFEEHTTTHREEDKGDPVLGLFGRMDDRSEPVDLRLEARVRQDDARILLTLTDPEGDEVVLKRYVTPPHPDAEALAGQYMLEGGNRAQIMADEPIIRAMTREGRMPFEDAATYMCGGCMELNPHGMNSDLLFSFVYNVPKTLELLITGGECLITGQHRLHDKKQQRYPDENRNG